MNEKFTKDSTALNTIQCRYFPVCSGCSMQKQLYSHPKHQMLESALKLKVPFIVDEVIFWRHKAKLAIGKKDNELRIGLYQQNSHEIISIPDCPLHTHAINPILKDILKEISASGITVYSETSFRGVLRYIQLVEERNTKKVSLTFVVNEEFETIQSHPFFSFLKKAIASNLHSIWVNIKKTQDNVIFGKEWHLLTGHRHVCQEILGKPFYFHPASFCQVHLKQYENVLMKIREWVQPKVKVLELYAGIGTIGKSIADLVDSVDCYENNPYAFECFDLSQKAYLDKNVSFFPFSAEDFEEQDHFNCLILDPPRKGLSQTVFEKITKLKGIQEIIALYCDLDSFLKDLEKLKKRGWKLEKIESYLFFPGSDHIEILGFLKRI